MTKHNGLYYDKNRNIDEFINKVSEIEYGIKIPENETPAYYIGNKGLEAIDVIHQFNLSYDLGSACSYILRAKNKHKDGGKECITKAIEHLKYELRKLEG
tara:strand:+ start:26287 stop:26586 length:300 start_codon:yes stop_codon:yes gene_type:complete